MNIFYLDEDPKMSAQWQCDKHVVKMILESAQLLSTAHRELDGDDWGDEVGLYKSTHKNHPSAVWARSSKPNYDWLYDHFCALCDEYRYRYGKEHLTWRKFSDVLDYAPPSILHTKFEAPPQCMPDPYKHSMTVKAYRNYYTLDKSTKEWFCYKKGRCRPWWLSTGGSFYAK
ncbi:MAG: hypothetical protein CMA63_06190 [Euryarchaeota archaeon]|jgi:hypothetical protein|nr:hypothetical protein [Euryarchaeota archaeon]|tara:strand:+ start:7843 stop:8358 length:516 start_codon:yes stop_codon:yes gene_type:complete